MIIAAATYTVEIAVDQVWLFDYKMEILANRTELLFPD